MSSGGVEPETVELWRFCVVPGTPLPRWRSSIRIPHPAEYSMETERCEFVPLSALRLVEEELRLERDLRRRAERSRENANAVSLRVEGENRRLSEELRQAREERDLAQALFDDADARAAYGADRDAIALERDALADAIERHEDSMYPDPAFQVGDDSSLTGRYNKRLYDALAALRTSGPQAPIQSPPVSGCGEIAQDGDTEETT